MWSTASAWRGKAGWARPTSSTAAPAEEFLDVAPGADALESPQGTRVRRGESASAPGSSSSVCTRPIPTRACALDHRNAYQLLVATILSAQCTDARVNMVTPAFFARYPTPEALARADRAGGGGADPVHRILPQQGAEPRRDGAGARRGPSAARCRERMEELRVLPGGRTEDRERRPGKRLRNQRGHHGRHPRHPAVSDCSVSPGMTTR